MVRESRHSMLVAWAKVALPLAALALLSTLFLFSGKIDPTTASIYAKVDVDALAREPRHPRSCRNIPARSGATAEDVIAKLEAASGLVADLSAKSGRIDPSAGDITLSDGVAMQTSTGYRLSTTQMILATDRSKITAPEAVQAEAPFGTITSGSMELSRPAADAPYDLVFNGGVKLVYQPEK